MMMPNEADSELQIEIDEWVLDYLIYNAIGDVLEDYKSLWTKVDHDYEQEKGALPLQLVDCEYSISTTNIVTELTSA